MGGARARARGSQVKLCMVSYRTGLIMNQGMIVRHIYISQAHMIQYGGSEMVTLELAEYFSSLGIKVTIGTWAVGNPMMGHLKSLQNVEYFDIDSQALQDVLASDPPQLAWIHHQIIPRRLLQVPSACAFVYNHMSSTHPLEFTWSPLEAELASVHLFNSIETLESQKLKGLGSTLNPDNLHLFANPAPDAFREVTSEGASHMKNIGVVTNHLPVELEELLSSPPDGFNFFRIGYSGGIKDCPARLTPSLIASFDGVITIGKTVQYALVAGIPVYCYDHFGGPGWLGIDNFTVAETNNFSGRGFDRKTSRSISEEIVGHFSEAQLFAKQLRETNLSRFSLSSLIDNIFKIAEQTRIPASAFSHLHVEAHLAQQGVVGHYVRNWLRSSDRSR